MKLKRDGRGATLSPQNLLSRQRLIDFGLKSFYRPPRIDFDSERNRILPQLLLLQCLMPMSLQELSSQQQAILNPPHSLLC